MSNVVLETIEVGPIQQLQTLRAMFGNQEQRLSTTALAALASLMTAVRIPAGTQVSYESDAVSKVYFVLEGGLQASRGGKNWGLFGPRSTVGVLSALSRDRGGFDCVAVEDTLALMLRTEDMLEILEDHFEVMHSALKGIARDAIELRRVLPNAGFSNVIREDLPCPTRPMDLVERILCLRRSFALDVSFIDELAQIARSAHEVRYAKDTRLWSIGDYASHVLILVCGVVQGTTAEGETFRLGPGDIFGNLDTVSGQPRWFDAVVVQPVVAFELHGEVMIDVWEDHPELAFDFLRMIAAMMISLRERVTQFKEQLAVPQPPQG